jgi:hypothetical protein
MMSVKSNIQLNSNDFNYSINVYDQSKKIHPKLARIITAIYSVRSKKHYQIKKKQNFINHGRNTRTNNNKKHRIRTIWFDIY